MQYIKDCAYMDYEMDFLLFSQEIGMFSLFQLYILKVTFLDETQKYGTKL